MIDLFGADVPEPARRIAFSDMEVDEIYDHLIGEGELLKDLASNLEKLQKINPNDLSMNAVRKAAWKDFIWVFGIDEPSPIPFDIACDICGADDECIRAGISKAFGTEIRMMHKSLCAQVPHLSQRLTLYLGRYVDLELN